MHEYSLMQRVMEVIQGQLEERGERAAVREVLLKVGMLDIHSEDAFRQAFEVLARGTALEQARLSLTIEPARIACAECGYGGELSQGQADPHDPNPYVLCPRCGVICPVQGGHGVESIELIMNDPA